MEWIAKLVQSPDVLMGAVGALFALLALSVRGAKAKLTEEIIGVIDKKFEDTAALKLAQDETVSVSIEALRSDVDGLKTNVGELRIDVRDMAQDLKTIMSNGFLKH